jgi:endonuclease V
LDAGDKPLSYIGGVDISFIKEDCNQQYDFDACAMFVVLSFPSLEVIYEDKQMVKLELPYISGFLAFREAPFLIHLVEKLRSTQPSIMPQVNVNLH